MNATQELKMYINGAWEDSSNGKQIDVKNPATGQVMAQVPSASKDDVKSAIDAAKDSFNSGTWSKLPPGVGISIFGILGFLNLSSIGVRSSNSSMIFPGIFSAISLGDSPLCLIPNIPAK